MGPKRKGDVDKYRKLDEGSLNMKKPNEGRRKSTSGIWNHFTKVGGNEGDRFAVCKHCPSKLSYKTTISNLKKHVERKHPNEVKSDIMHAIHSITQDFEQVGEEYEIESDSPEVIELEEEVMHITPNKLLMPKKTLLTQTPMKTLQSLPSQKRVKLTHPNNKSQMIQDAINILSTVSHEDPTPENDDDEFSQFGKYLISQLRQLPLVNALQLQEKFQSLLTRERINLMLKSNDSHSTLKSCIQQHQCSQHHNQCAPVESSCSCQTQFVQQNQDTHRSMQYQILQTSENNQSSGKIEISCVSSQADQEVHEQNTENISSSKCVSDL